MTEQRGKSIAVLPFVNMSNEADNEYFSDGITEEIINALTKIDGLKVIARSSSFAFKGKHIDLRKVGKQLGVSTILEGSVRKSEKRVRITAQLIDTGDGSHIWSKNFDRELEDIFELQDEISLLIADSIRENFGHLEISDHLVHIDTKNVEAYKWYLRGRYARLKWNNAAVSQAIVFYKESITIDPGFSEAYFELGWCYCMLASWGYLEKEQGLKDAEHYTDKGFDLNPESYLGYYAKATISFWGYWNYKDTYRYLEKSVLLNPKHSEVYNATTDLYSSMGYLDLALEENEKALQVDPLSVNHHFTTGNLLYFKGQYDKAIKHFNKALEFNRTFPLGLEMKAAALILSQKENALRHYLKVTPSLEKPYACKDLYNLMYGKPVFDIGTREVDENTGISHPAYLSLRLWNLYLQIYLGNHELALKVLEQKIKRRSGQIFNFKNDPFLNPLRKYEAYKQLEKSVFSDEVMPDIVVKTATESKSSNPLNNQQVQHYCNALNEVLEKETVYLDTNLSLTALAKHIDLHPNKLSWLLNFKFNKNFNDYINQYRLSHFKTIALNPKNAHITILGLAYDSGFNSKSVFNTYFKKTEGLTPSQWVKLQSR